MPTRACLTRTWSLNVLWSFLVALTLVSCLQAGRTGTPSGPTGLCPDNFVLVPGSSDLGVDDFCAAKYEMKIVGNDDGDQVYDPAFRAESRAQGTPWKNLNMAQAVAECEALGEGYHLVSNEEWMTIARDIESTAANWSDGVAHPSGSTTARINVGHICRAPNLCRGNPSRASHAFFGQALAASEDDREGCFGLPEFRMPMDDGKSTANLDMTRLSRFDSSYLTL